MTISARKHRIIRLISSVTIILSLIAVACFADFALLSDRLKASDYTPSKEIHALIQDLRLTSRAKIILNATYPAIYDSDTFNRHCRKNRSEDLILGCYVNDSIYLFNIENVDLTGIKQSTLAHELLHAIWQRIPKDQQNELSVHVQRIYVANKELLDERLSSYPKSEHIDELHSIIGTEILIRPQTACPDNSCADSVSALAEHYAKYFNAQDTIVAFYNQYRAPFDQLKEEASQTYAQVEANRSLIATRVADCKSAIDALNAAISEFNHRAEKGYFTNTFSFETERANLVARQSNLEKLFKDIEKLVQETNDLITEYNNSHIARAKGLIDSIDSRPDTDINKIDN